MLISLPDKHIGPLKADARKAGPGHYVAPGANFVPGGKWKVQIVDRVSEFDQYETTVDVPIDEPGEPLAYAPMCMQCMMTAMGATGSAAGIKVLRRRKALLMGDAATATHDNDRIARLCPDRFRDARIGLDGEAGPAERSRSADSLTPLPK